MPLDTFSGLLMRLKCMRSELRFVPRWGAYSAYQSSLAGSEEARCPFQRTPVPLSAFGLEFRPFGPSRQIPGYAIASHSVADAAADVKTSVAWTNTFLYAASLAILTPILRLIQQQWMRTVVSASLNIFQVLGQYYCCHIYYHYCDSILDVSLLELPCLEKKVYGLLYVT